MHITIASMGADGMLSQDVLDAAKTASAVMVQTKLSGLPKMPGISFETLDDIYETADDFDSLIEVACGAMMRNELLFIALGEIWLNEIAIGFAKRVIGSGGTVRVIGEDAALSAALEEGLITNACGICTFTASFVGRVNDTDTLLVVHEIDTRVLACELKIKLLQYYDDEKSVLFVNLKERTRKVIPLCEIDSQPDYGYYTSMVVAPTPLASKKRYTFADLISVMDRLRSENGCPWDREQTHASLKRYLVEESYEVLEAIDDNDMNALYDELGDVLLQVVFHAKIGSQRGEFDVTDITSAICQKMISRHTHIFGTDIAETPDAVIDNWELIKREEKGQQNQTDVLKGVPKSMPALMRSGKVQHKAAHVGFDFREISEPIGKLREEIEEVEQDIADGRDLWEECGDMLFAAVNVVRLLGVEPEVALQKATDKFITRFGEVEKIALARNIDMKTCTIAELDEIWGEAKKKTEQSS